MLRSDWLSYYLAICYSPLAAKSAGFENQLKQWRLNRALLAKVVCLDILDQLVGFY